VLGAAEGEGYTDLFLLPKLFLDYPFNTSLMVRDALPHRIERAGKPDIRILKYARATLDSYEDIRRVSKEIWQGDRSIFIPSPKSEEENSDLAVDVILHLGMEIRKEEFCLETRARRDGYEKPGEDGKYIDPDHFKDTDLPPVLSTGFDVEAAFEKVHAKFPVSRASE
jgi:hypothetical protein